VLSFVRPLLAARRSFAKPAECQRNSWFVFSTTKGVRPFGGFSKAKGALDAEISRMRKETGHESMPRWTLHDLRRTGRSLMSRAKVPSDHAERVMGHVIGCVRETYDRYEYLDEKRDALNRLSDLLQEIISQPTISLQATADSSAQLAAA
jgi:integrase